MKKWADLKCDGKRRIVALRGPNGSHLRKKNLGPVERMVHKILMLSPRGGEEKHVKRARCCLCTTAFIVRARMHIRMKHKTGFAHEMGKKVVKGPARTTNMTA